MEFTATIYREGVNFLVEVPEEISKGFDEKGYIYVKGTANGYSFYSTLVPRGGGCHKLFLKGEIRKAAKVGEGDEVQLTLERDIASRELPVPADLDDSLASHPEASEEFYKLSTSHRREILLWINEAKKAETRLKRIEKTLDHLVERIRSKK